MFSHRNSVRTPDEKTPLLLKVVVEGGEQKRTSTEPLLLNEIDACIRILEEAKGNIKPKVDSINETKNRYTGLGLFNSATLLGIPAATLKLFFACSEQLFQNRLPMWQKQILELGQKIQAAENDNNRLWDLYLSFCDKAQPWLNITENSESSWRNSQLCTSWHPIDDFEGDYANCWDLWDLCKVVDNPSPYSTCNDIAKNWCDAFQHIKSLGEACFNETIVPPMANDDLIYESSKAIDALNDLVDKKIPTIDPISLGIFISASVISVVAAIYLLDSWLNTRKEYRQAFTKVHCVDQCINDPHDARRIINITSRFKISLTDLTVDNLIEKLQAERESALQRLRQRIAFFKGSFDGDATNQHFLTCDGSRDIIRIIFKEAGLLPNIK